MKKAEWPRNYEEVLGIDDSQDYKMSSVRMRESGANILKDKPLSVDEIIKEELAKCDWLGVPERYIGNMLPINPC